MTEAEYCQVVEHSRALVQESLPFHWGDLLNGDILTMKAH